MFGVVNEGEEVDEVVEDALKLENLQRTKDALIP